MLGNDSALSKSLSHPTAHRAVKNHFSELPGTVHAQYRRRGSKTYGPYYFRFWRENGRLRKTYVKRTDLDEARARCQARQNRRRERLRSLDALRATRTKSRAISAEIRNFRALNAIVNLLDRKNEYQLTDLQRRRVLRTFAAAGIEI